MWLIVRNTAVTGRYVAVGVAQCRDSALKRASSHHGVVWWPHGTAEDGANVYVNKSLWAYGWPIKSTEKPHPVEAVATHV